VFKLDPRVNGLTYSLSSLFAVLSNLVKCTAEDITAAVIRSWWMNSEGEEDINVIVSNPCALK